MRVCQRVDAIAGSKCSFQRNQTKAIARRQRVAQPGREAAHRMCPHLQGAGHIAFTGHAFQIGIDDVGCDRKFGAGVVPADKRGKIVQPPGDVEALAAIGQ